MKRTFYSVLLTAFFSAVHSYGQGKNGYDHYLNISNGGLCSQTLLLYKDSTYCSESGCESSSHFSFGNWKQQKNTITFTPADPAKYNFISRVETSTTNEKYITVIIYDNQGRNITKWVAAGQYVTDIGTYSFDLDSSKTKRTDLRRTNGKIVLKSLQQLSRQKIAVNIDTSNLYKIHLTIPVQWVMYPDADWDKTGTFNLTIIKDKLVSPRPDQVDAKGVFGPTEFTRQTR